MKQYIALCSAGSMNDYRFIARDNKEALRAFAVDYQSLPQHWTYEIYELKPVGVVPDAELPHPEG